MIDNINPFKYLIALSNELNAIRLQNTYIIQTQKNNALIDELSRELKALVIVQNELKNDRERFIPDYAIEEAIKYLFITKSYRFSL